MAKLKEVISSPTKQLTDEVKETLNLVYELSEEKAKSFENQIATGLRTAGTIENPTVPITEILGCHQEVRVITKDSLDEHITQEIGGALKGIICGGTDNIINGITRLIDTGLRTVLGTAQGEERFEKSYYIATEGLSIIRLDLMYWSRHISAKSIMEHAEKSLVCTVVKSSVDMEKLSFNAFLAAYQKQLSRCNFSIEELKKEIENAKEIYTLFKPNTMQGTVNGINVMSAMGGRTEAVVQHNFGVLESKQNPVSDIWPPQCV